MMLQLSPQIPVMTPKGTAQAIGWIDYSEEHHLIWICFQDETCECWLWPNDKIRAIKNPTMGRIPVPEYKDHSPFPLQGELRSE